MNLTTMMPKFGSFYQLFGGFECKCWGAESNGARHREFRNSFSRIEFRVSAKRIADFFQEEDYGAIALYRIVAPFFTSKINSEANYCLNSLLKKILKSQ